MKQCQTDRPGVFGDAKRQLMVEQVVKDAPGKAGLFQRVYGLRASPRQAIKAFCLECVWLDERAIRECAASACPLHSFRPYVRSHKKKKEGGHA